MAGWYFQYVRARELINERLAEVEHERLAQEARRHRAGRIRRAAHCAHVLLLRLAGRQAAPAVPTGNDSRGLVAEARPTLMVQRAGPIHRA